MSRETGQCNVEESMNEGPSMKAVSPLAPHLSPSSEKNSYIDARISRQELPRTIELGLRGFKRQSHARFSL